MQKKFYLLFSLLLCLALAGCTEDTNETGRNSNDAGNGSDAADVIEDTSEDASEDGTPDSGPSECTSDDDCAAAANQVGICDLGTNTCTYACNQGFDDCDGDTANGCEVDITTSIDHCRSCGNTCDSTSLRLLPVCTDTGCDVDPSQCAQDFVDLDGDGSNGCECEVTDGNDLPDADGQDANCDGIDGIAERAVFVSKDGDDANNDGLSQDAPLASITAGIKAATDHDRDLLLVGGGVFDETVSLKSGVSIYGGYDSANGWARDPDNQDTRIEPEASTFASGTEHYKTVAANGITDATVLDHLTIVGADAATPGASSYAVWAKASDALTLQNITIIGGSGAAGADGSPGTTANCTTHDGGVAGTSSANDSPCALATGTRADAGTKGLPIQSGGGEGGLGGIHACKQERSSCSDAVDGHHGVDGADGAHGTNGAPASDAIGAIANGQWVAATNSTPPSDGAPGAGGGAGGAGASCEDSDAFCNSIICPDNVDVGGDGGGGGHGGCQGTAGENGQAGGGAFGIFAVDSDLTLNDSELSLGRGGDGGNGSDGGAGQAGPEGADGQSGETRHAGWGGNGGDGGNGGNGGAGAGGCAGPTIGLAFADSTIDKSTLSINQGAGETGQPGQGGQRPDGETAPAGCDGELKSDHDFSADSGS